MIGFSVIIFLSLILYYLPYIRFLDKFNFKKVLICMLIGILFLNTVDVQAIAGVSVNVINSILKPKTKVKVGIGDTAKVVGSNDFLEGFYYGTNQVGNEIYVNEKSINVNGKDIVAYCLDQTKTGPDTSGYDVTFTDNLDSILHEVLMRGYPKKSAQDLGLNSDKDAYFVTAMAVYMNTNYSNLNLWHITSGDDQAYKQKMLDIAKDISGLKRFISNDEIERFSYNSDDLEKFKKVILPSNEIITISDDEAKKEYIAYSKLKEYSQTLLNKDANSETIITPEKAEANLVNDNYTYNYNVSGPKYTVELSDDNPFKAKILDATGSEKYEFASGESFTVSVHKNNVKYGDNINIEVYSESTSFKVRNSDPDYQPNGLSTTVEANMTISMPTTAPPTTAPPTTAPPTTAPPTTAPPTTPATPTTPPVTTPPILNANIKVQKVNALTKELVSGALVEMRGISPTNSHIKIEVVLTAGAQVPIPNTNGGYVKLGDGFAEIYKVPIGTYRFEELSAPNNYSMLPMPNVRTVDIDESQADTILDIVTFENYPYGEILLQKIDEVTGKPLEGAQLRLTNPLFDYDNTVTTDSSGQARLENLQQGTYVISEVYSPEGYLLSSEKQEAIVRWGQTTTVTFKNTPKAVLEVIKIDADTNQTLPDAIFSLKDNTTGIIAQETSDSKGVATFSGLEPNKTYILTEIKAPSGYILDNVPRDIVLTNEKITTITIENKKIPKLTIIKRDKDTGKELQGAVFEIERINGDNAGKITGSPFTTDETGRIIINQLETNSYKITEIQAPPGYNLSDPNYTVINMEASKDNVVTFENTRQPELKIIKLDEITGATIKNTEFTIEKLEDPNKGMLTGNPFTTDDNGEIVVSPLFSGKYKITETKPAPGYTLPSVYEWIIEIKDNQDYTLKIENIKLPALLISKYNSLSGKPVPNTYFKIDYEMANGSIKTIGTYKTDTKGQIIIKNLQPGWYVITEVRAAPGMQLPSNPTRRVYLNPGDNVYDIVSDETAPEPNNTPEPSQTPKPAVDNSNLTKPMPIFNVGGGDDYANGEDIPNYPLNSIVIKKSDAITGELLQGATFELRQVSGDLTGQSGTLIATLTTDHSGIIVVTGLDGGGYIIEEVKAPYGYLLSENNRQQVWLKPDGTSIEELTYSNYPYSSLLITKVDAKTNKPLQGAKFKVVHDDGTVAGSGESGNSDSQGSTNGIYTSDINGEILITNLKPDGYVVTEIEAPQGYELDGTAQNVRVNPDGRIYKLEFKNSPKSGLIINKFDEQTKKSLPGAEFKVTTSKGIVIGTGSHITDINGVIHIPDLAKDTYIVTEIKAPNGYILESETKTIAIDYGDIYTLDFFNKPLSDLRIIKLNESTRYPIQGAEFYINKIDGEHVLTSQNNRTFRTDRYGEINVTGLSSGYYEVREVKAPIGFILNPDIYTVKIESGKTTVLEVFNKPESSLLIVKSDKQTKKALQGVVFEVLKTNGERVGTYKTDSDGRIYINNLQDGEYEVIERETLQGYKLDNTPYKVLVKDGEQTRLNITNEPLGGLRLKKINSVSKEPIYGVEFMLFDKNGRAIGNFYTDNQGLIDFSGIIEPGRYTIRETRPAKGYYGDETPRTIEFVSGKTTEIIWENTPEAGQIQITKVSADDNEQNGLSANTPLAGAIFEVYEYKTGNIVDRFITDSNGKGVSIPLPLGRYLIKETQAPPYYKLSIDDIDIDIEFANQIVKMQVPNLSSNTGVSIDKIGPHEAMPGQNIYYDLKTVKNDSTVPLTDFYFREIIPTNIVRPDKIVTGTYNISLKYKITATTNKGNDIVVTDNLKTTKNNVVYLGSAHLGLNSDEYIDTFTVMFGNVPAGFTAVEKPRIYVDVIKNGLLNGQILVNKVDIGGKYNNEWIISNSTWPTVIYNLSTLPRTGY